MDWKNNGGTIINKSGRTLIIAFDHPTGNGWGYMPLSPNRKTAAHIDADGFRVREEGVKISYKYPGIAQLEWWKIRNGMLATVYEGKDNFGVPCVNFETQLKNYKALARGLFLPNIIFDDETKYAIGSAFLSPDPKTNQDFGWFGTNPLMPEYSVPIS